MDNLALLLDTPSLALQLLADGVLVGAIFALVAYGMALTWGVMNVINITQGELVMLGGYAAIELAKTGAPPLLGVPVAAVVMFVVGWLLYKVVIHRVVDRDLFTSLLATFGLSILIQQLANEVFGADIQSVPSGMGSFIFAGGMVTVGKIKVVAFVIALAVGAITADSLRQETTSNHPMPADRATGYGAGVFLVLAGLACGWLYLRGGGIGWVVGGIVPVLAGAGLLSYLGATQTNRHKQWVMRMAESHAAVGNRFTEDPSAAARFGIYTVVVWIVALAGFVLLTLTVGWLWSWLAIVGGLVAMMILVARMLFVPSDS